MHPNIVNVYDVGEENDVYFIVMELVEGITLKKYIERKARLSVKEAISIAIQVSMGIEAAHNNHIIHRDIKPQNIIISKEGKVKVTDFGIAKAATSNTITSNVMGSVHYTSPEQARGGYSDEKSDIYSLGITMFEMLTGRVPFNGETTVAIAIKHIQEPLPSPREYVSEIPISVEQIVFKCCQKSPDRRYQTMGDLIVDLKQSLINPDEDFVKMVNPDEEASTRMITDKDMVQIKKQSVKRDSMDEALRLKKDVRRKYQEEDEEEEDEEDVIGDEEEEDVEDDIDDEEEEYDSKMERVTTVLAVVAALLIGCIVLFLVGKTLGILPFGGEKEKTEESTEEESGKVEMPKVVGRQIEEVKTELLGLGLMPEIAYKETDEYEAGLVLECNIGIGQMVDSKTDITLTVSAGASGVEVPNVVGMSTAQGVSNLEQKGFVVNKTESYDAEVAKGDIISQSPEAGIKAPSGSAVTIRISQGAEDNKVRVPNLIGISEMDAMAAITENGLVVGSVTEINHEDESLNGLVCYQSYSVGSYVDQGTAIDLQVSLGPKQGTYSFNGSIEAPSAAEDPEYREGLDVTVTIDTADGVQLLNTSTASFPISVNYTGIRSATGTVTFTYMVTTDAITDTNPETGEVTTTEGTSVQKTIARELQFTPES